MVLFKMVILGDGGCGKSALTIQLVQNHFTAEYDPTIENSYKKQVTVDSEAYMLDILDTAGQEEYVTLRDQYISVGEGFLLVYSLTNRDSFTNLPKFREEILRLKEESNFPVVIAGNKCDLESYRKVEQNEGMSLAKSWGVPFFETSAKVRVNVEESFFCSCPRD